MQIGAFIVISEKNLYDSLTSYFIFLIFLRNNSQLITPHLLQ